MVQVEISSVVYSDLEETLDYIDGIRYKESEEVRLTEIQLLIEQYMIL